MGCVSASLLTARSAHKHGAPNVFGTPHLRRASTFCVKAPRRSDPRFHSRSLWTMLGVFRAAPSACAVAFGVPRFLTSCAFHRGVRTCHSTIEARPCSFQTRHARSMCLWAAATETAPRADKAREEEVDDVEEFENELDAMVVDGDADAPSGEPPSPRKLRWDRYIQTSLLFVLCYIAYG